MASEPDRAPRGSDLMTNLDFAATGIEDCGAAPPDGGVWLNLPAGEGRVITAQELESGGDAQQGRLGSGSGKRRLFASSSAPIEVSSLLDSPTCNLSKLSSRGR